MQLYTQCRCIRMAEQVCLQMVWHLQLKQADNCDLQVHLYRLLIVLGLTSYDISRSCLLRCLLSFQMCVDGSYKALRLQMLSQ